MNKMLGTDDSVNACDCCGKTGLKFTFAVEIESGEVVHYGSTCVTRHTGKTPANIANEIAAREAAEKAVREAEYRNTYEAIAYSVRMERARQAGLLGKAFKDFCIVERVAADAKRAEIFA
jgi:hypothetical protein